MTKKTKIIPRHIFEALRYMKLHRGGGCKTSAYPQSRRTLFSHQTHSLVGEPSSPEPTGVQEKRVRLPNYGFGDRREIDCLIHFFI